MIALSVMMATIAVAFPRFDRPVTTTNHCYMIGIASRGATNIVVQGKSVKVYPTRAWTALVDVTGGVNRVEISDVGGTVEHEFKIVNPRPISPNAKPKVYEKVPGTEGEPKVSPIGRPASEITVMLDPGHGGKSDWGCISPHGGLEKDINLLLAKDVAAELRQRGFKVVMTRETDVAVALLRRPVLAVESKADLFVSIHHNAPAADKDPGTVRFSSVYFWNDLGKSLANSISNATNWRSLHANFAVTRNEQIPSCLVEADFITHPDGEVSAWTAASRQKTAAMIADGISAWCGIK